MRSRLSSNDHTRRGVSPVIATILLVAVVVVLAATVSIYLTGTADDLPSTDSPQAALSADYVRDTANDGYTLAVAYQGGDVLDTSALNLTVGGV
jgi:flagellin-like protein